MTPPETKSITLAIILAFVAAMVAALMSGCDSGKEPGHTINAGPTADDVELFAKRQNFVTKHAHKEALESAYWQGVEDQALSLAQGKPLYITDFRDGKLLIFKPVKSFEDRTAIQTAQAEAVIEATEKPLKKK